MKKIIVSLLIGALMIFSAGGCGSSSAGKTDNATAKGEIKIGSILSVTGKGAAYGEKSLIAGQMAVEKINQAGGVKGQQIKLINYDSRGENQEAVSLTRKLATEDNALAIIGIIFSAETEVTFPVANQLKVPIISTSSAKPGVSAANRPWAFRNTVTEEKLVRQTLEKYKKLYGVKKVALVADVKDAYSKSVGLDVFPPELKNAGITIVNEKDPITYNSGDTNFTAQVTKLKSMDFDGVSIGGLYNEPANFINEMRRQGLKQPVVGGVGFMNDEFIKLGGKNVEGSMLGATFWPANPDPKAQEFVTEFKKRAKGEEPDYRAAAMYDTVFILKDLIEKQGLTGDLAKDREMIRKGFETLKDWKGIMGNTSIDNVGDGAKETYTLIVKDGKFVRVTD